VALPLPGCTPKVLLLIVIAGAERVSRGRIGGSSHYWSLPTLSKVSHPPHHYPSLLFFRSRKSQRFRVSYDHGAATGAYFDRNFATVLLVDLVSLMVKALMMLKM
jgi:hypothetical protein